jgi:hypothetical protein
VSHSGGAGDTRHTATSDSSVAQRLARMESEISSLASALEDLRARVELLKPNT